MVMDFFWIKALSAGIAVAVMCSVLGCFVTWQRLAYLGDTIAHAALLGVVLSLMLYLPVDVGIIGTALLVAFILAYFRRERKLSSDTILGIIAHGALALALVLISFANITVDVNAYLFGDILAVNTTDVILMALVASLVLAVIRWHWRDLMRVTLHADIAAVEGVRVGRVQKILVLILALTVAVSIKIVGMLLVTALLVIPAAAARHFAVTPPQMIVYAVAVGCISVIAGLMGSIQFDTPSGPSVIVSALAIFLISHLRASRS